MFGKVSSTSVVSISIPMMFWSVLPLRNPSKLLQGSFYNIGVLQLLLNVIRKYFSLISACTCVSCQNYFPRYKTEVCFDLFWNIKKYIYIVYTYKHSKSIFLFIQEKTRITNVIFNAFSLLVAWRLFPCFFSAKSH